MFISCEQHLAEAKLIRERARWVGQQERIAAVKRSNDFLILAVKAARERGGIDISNFDFDALNPDWNVIDAQVAALAPIVESPTAPKPTETPDIEVDGPNRISQLIKIAIESPTPQGLADFLEFTTKFRRLSVWNARMAHIQRPGARVIASEFEWQKVGRSVAPDAVPILILWPFGPIRYVYELGDTNPPISHNDIADPFAAIGEFRPGILTQLAKSLSQQKIFHIKIVNRRLGSDLAGTAATQGVLPMAAPFGDGCRIGKFAAENAETETRDSIKGIPSYRVTVNDRLQPGERFTTIAHELGHIFCGHLGACFSQKKEDESGWPDRRGSGLAEQEVEAESVAYLVASRAGLTTGSAAYLKDHAKRANIKKINIDLIVRAAARIERLSKIHHGSMRFHE